MSGDATVTYFSYPFIHPPKLRRQDMVTGAATYKKQFPLKENNAQANKEGHVISCSANANTLS
jgi:hypothetical protein